MAAGLMAWTTPHSEQWFRSPDLALRQSDRTKRWLQDRTQLMQSISRTRISTRNAENLLNKCAFGTSSMFMELQDNRQLRLRPCNAVTTASKDAFGQVRSIYRKFSKDAMQLVEWFGEENVSKDVKSHHEATGKGQARQTFDVIHAVYPREDDDIPENGNRAATSTCPSPPATSKWMPKHMLREGGRRSCSQSADI